MHVFFIASLPRRPHWTTRLFLNVWPILSLICRQYSFESAAKTTENRALLLWLSIALTSASCGLDRLAWLQGILWSIVVSAFVRYLMLPRVHGGTDLNQSCLFPPLSCTYCSSVQCTPILALQYNSVRRCNCSASVSHSQPSRFREGFSIHPDVAKPPHVPHSWQGGGRGCRSNGGAAQGVQRGIHEARGKRCPVRSSNWRECRIKRESDFTIHRMLWRSIFRFHSRMTSPTSRLFLFVSKDHVGIAGVERHYWVWGS